MDGLGLLVKGEKWSFRPLLEVSSQVEKEEDLVLVFLDPSAEAPGWPLQNALALMSKHRPGRRRVLAFRDPQLARGASQDASGSSSCERL